MKMKKRGDKGGVKRNKSVSDLEVDFCCSQVLGSRSFSHDSIFLADQNGSEPEQQKVLSQENIHGNIHALQFVSQSVSSRPLDPIPLPLCSAGVDFSTLPLLIPCLDNSAARHRMSIKPRNQRASTKSRRILSLTESRPRLESMIILEQAHTDSENEEGNVFTKKMACVCSYTTQIIKPGEGPTSPLIKRPLSASSLKSSLGAKNTVNQIRESISPTSLRQDHISRQQTQTCESKSTDGLGAAIGTWQASKSAEGMMTKTSTTVLTIQKRGADQRDSLNNSKLNSVQSFKQSLELNETQKGKESYTITNHDKGHVLEKNGVKEAMHQHNHKSQSMRHLSLHRNTTTVDSKVEVRNVKHMCTVRLPGVEGNLQKQMVPDMRNEQQYTGNFTGPVAKVAQFRDIHVVPGRDSLPVQTSTASNPFVPVQPVNQLISFSVNQQRGLNQERPIKFGAEEANTASDAMEETNIICQRKEKEGNALRVKLHTTSLPLKIPADTTQSEYSIKQTITEIHRQTDGQANIPKNVTSTLLRNPQIINTNSMGSRALLKSSRDQANIVPVRQPDMEPLIDPPYSSIKANTALPSLPLEEVIMKNSVQTDAKEPSETSNVQSWMEIALEKTRSLQQLFSSTLNEFAGLQTTTRPTASSKNQISTPINNAEPINQILLEQSSVMPQTIGTQPPNIQSSVKSTASTVMQPADIQYSLTPAFSTTEAANVSVKQYLSRNIRQRVQLGASPGQSSETYEFTTEFNTPCKPQEQLCQTLYQPPCLPELILHPHSQLSPSPILHKRQQYTRDWTSMSQRKSTTEHNIQWVGTLPSEHIQQHYVEKVADKKSTILFQEMELGAKTGDLKLRAFSGNFALGKEDKCPRKIAPSSSSSSSSPFQFFTDSGQPPWMELAKNKSMAWSDKTMD